MAVSIYISIVTLNIRELNASIKRHRNDTCIYMAEFFHCSPETPTILITLIQNKIFKVWEKQTNKKDTECLNGYKNKTHLYVAYKRLFRPINTHRVKVGGCKKVFHANGQKSKVGVVIIILKKCVY